jgi:hypothetical protein
MGSSLVLPIPCTKRLKLWRTIWRLHQNEPEATKRTGHDLPAIYRETAEGGLALLVE